MSIAKNTKETFLEEIIDNLSGNTRELPIDCKPRTREEVLLAEIEKNTRELKNDEPINIDLSNYYTKEETNNLVEEQTNSVINDSNTSSTNTWSSQKIVDYVATVDDVIFEEANGSVVTVNNSVEGYLKDVEIKGNTIQDENNLADIKSVGDKLEGQELYKIPVLSCGKNLFDGKLEIGGFSNGTPNTSSNDYRNKNVIRVKPNTTYGIYQEDTTNFLRISTYDENINYIQYVTGNAFKFTTPSNCVYINFHFPKGTCNIDTKISIVESDNKLTTYIPYIEDKLTILSPVQIEKVGNVADRIVEKDGVWGVEKNITDELIDLSSVSSINVDMDNTAYIICKSNNTFPTIAYYNNQFINNLLPSIGYNDAFSNDSEGVGVSGQWVRVRVLKSKLKSLDLQGAKEFIEKLILKYPTTQPQFIQLPHDQQVKLRTFANKTNISFLTEIEGTIKAQVPKSLGATVNTHTEQISNLNKELDRVKKLEESTVSTVETGSDFTTVEATSNGYFEDVKLEGKTLVNLFDESNFITEDITLNGCSFTRSATGTKYGKISMPLDKLSLLKSRGKYKVVVNITKNTLVEDGGKQRAFEFHTYSYGGWAVESSTDGNYSLTFAIGEVGRKECIITMKDFDSPSNPINACSLSFQSSYYATSGELEGQILILECKDDLPQDVNFFQGLKSVGDGADEIVVSSSNKNFIDIVHQNEIIPQTGVLNERTSESWQTTSLIKLKKNNYVFSTVDGDGDGYTYVYIYDLNGVYKGIDYRIDLNTSKKSITLNEDCLIRISTRKINTTKFQLEIRSTLTNYETKKQDKKRLLFYNNETQTWEKPVLREWDSIEKHSDGKYYYHQRSGEVVLNGSEDWIIGSETFKENCYYFRLRKLVPSSEYAIGFGNHICNRYVSLENGRPDSPGIAIIKGNGFNDVEVIELKTNFTSYDNALSSFKENMSNSSIVIVYQLAEEKVYECTNIDLITYANETNYVVECGAISPKSTLKVHNNISNVVSLLQKKVSLLEGNMTKYMITQNRMQLASTYSADSVTFKVDYALCSEETEEYNEDLYNLILNNILVGKDNYNYDKMFTMILDYVTWGQLSFENFDTLVGLMDIQHNPPIDEEVTEEI